MISLLVSLEEGEELVGEPDVICFRQITPHLFIDGDKVASHAFGPSGADNGKPSYSLSSKVTAQLSRDWHSKIARNPSLAVYGVSVSEVIESKSLVIDDSNAPLNDGDKRAPGHCYVDFRGLQKAEIRELRANLYLHAMKRGEIPTKALNEQSALDEGALF